MKLGEFIEMWESDGTRLVKEGKKRHNGHIWLLYSVYFPESTSGYGRHMAMILKVSSRNKEILMHDLKNITGEVTGNYRQGIDDWFGSHVGRY